MASSRLPALGLLFPALLVASCGFYPQKKSESDANPSQNSLEEIQKEPVATPTVKSLYGFAVTSELNYFIGFYTNGRYISGVFKQTGALGNIYQAMAFAGNYTVKDNSVLASPRATTCLEGSKIIEPFTIVGTDESPSLTISSSSVTVAVAKTTVKEINSGGVVWTWGCFSKDYQSFIADGWKNL